ncbi:MAG: spermidine/putrescine ABC transporter substrate-binding protein [Ruminococcaceae bacterium]|nr:spermidine/putrescine ABC transporter substrate-binding protein [Oscillospiraceae bacterium]
MKKIISTFLFVTLICMLCVPLTSCESKKESKTENSEVTTLYVYNWGEYISDGSEGTLDVNTMFEEWYFETYGQKIKVNYSTYSSNESMYAKISSGSVNYDVIVPSDYMIERMIKEDLIAPLDYDNIPNAQNILPEFQNAEYDPDKNADGYNDYSVPYLYGMIGIIYNTTMVDEADTGSWDLMWNEKYAGNILQFNNSRDAFGSAQYSMGDVNLVNSDSEEDWRRALEKLKEQKPILQGYVMDEIYNKMENGSAAIAAYYAGDFMAMYENNNDLEFFYPEEGTNLYVDAMCIPKSSQNKLIAERYINYMLSEEPAVANAEYTYYASPNRVVRDNEEYIEYMNEIKEGGYDLMYDTDAIPTSSYRNLSGEKLLLINTLWEELKSDITVSAGIYVLCGVIIGTLVCLGIFFAVRKKKRNIY